MFFYNNNCILIALLGLAFLSSLTSALAVPEPLLSKRVVNPTNGFTGLDNVVVSLDIKTKNGTFLCTGTRFTGGMIITSARYLLNEDNTIVGDTDVTVGFGSSIRAEQKTTKSVKVNISPDYITAKGFDPYYNIGIVTVNETVLDSVSVSVAAIAKNHQAKTAYVLAGWGVADAAEMKADVKPNANINSGLVMLGPDDQCKNGSSYFTSQDGPLLCTTNMDGHNTSVCSGDGGAGLLYKSEDGAWVIVGVVNFSTTAVSKKKCGEDGILTYYTRVDKYFEKMNPKKS